MTEVTGRGLVPLAQLSHQLIVYLIGVRIEKVIIMMMKEIKDFPGYFITEDGRVFSNNLKQLKELKPYISHKGYYKVILCKNKKRYNKFIHRLVTETYIPNPDNLPQVNHIDENKTNNHVSNLEWVNNYQNSVYSKCRWIWEIENIVTGEIQETINIREFSRNNNLHDCALHNTLTGKRKHHKNFRIIRKTQFK